MALSPSAGNFIFFFAWKILSIGRSSYIIRSQHRVLPLTVPSDSPIFFLSVKISLCSMPCSLFIAVLFSLYRYLLFLSLLFCFLFYRENCSFFYAYQPNFFFLRENPSLFLIKFLNKIRTSNVAALLFLFPVFFFFFVKTSLRSLLILPYIRASTFHAAFFFWLREIFSQ